MIKRPIALILVAVLAMSTALTGCGDDDKDTATPQQETSDIEGGEEAEGDEEYEDYDWDSEYADRIDVEDTLDLGTTATFVGSNFYDGTVNNEDDALDVVYAALEIMGGDDNTGLELDAIDGPTKEGNTYYTFRQFADDIKVYGAAVKLAVDKNGQVIGLNSTLVNGIDANKSVNWSIDASEAEAIVKQMYEDNDIKVRVIPNVTEQTLLPVDGVEIVSHYVWVVYTTNPYDDVHTAYLANYVDCGGEYLYSNPVSAPSDLDSLSGSGAAFAFEGLVADTWKGTVKKYHGEKEEVTIPVAKDPQTGDIYLADVDRKVMCADYADFDYHDTLTPRTAVNGKFTDGDVLIYKAFLEIYDYYDSLGWYGPDGDGSPVLLLLDWIDEDGKPVHNACYSGKIQGFDVFQFNRDEPDGEAYDTMAHEFTHAVTGAIMITNLYTNDYGAINEAMSDICGNLIESILGKTDDKTWLIMENGIEPIRSMSSPHDFRQPAFVWDKYYVPAASYPSGANDNGGVHTNSSLLNLIAYRLNESGMDQNDQLNYWMNVAYMLTPRTDYELIACILPWALEIVGQEKYMDVLNKAIAETGIADMSLPDKVSGNLANFRLVFPRDDILEAYNVTATVYNYDTEEEISTWAQDESNLISISIDPGNCVFMISIADEDTGEEAVLIRAKDGWEVYDYGEFDPNGITLDNIIELKAGQIVEFDPQELAEYFE